MPRTTSSSPSSIHPHRWPDRLPTANLNQRHAFVSGFQKQQSPLFPSPLSSIRCNVGGDACPRTFKKIQAELRSISYESFVQDTPHGEAVVFDYIIETGSHSGERVMIGLSFQEIDYPEYPPHWIHISPPIDDQLGGSMGRYTDDKNRDWLAMSRPPGRVWDNLPTKHMRHYIEEHLRRIWRNI